MNLKYLIALRLGGSAFHKTGAATPKADLYPVVLAYLISDLAKVLLPMDLSTS